MLWRVHCGWLCAVQHCGLGCAACWVLLACARALVHRAALAQPLCTAHEMQRCQHCALLGVNVVAML